MVTKLETETEKIINIDHRFFPSIIGSKGENIREIKENYNQVQIIFPSSGKIILKNFFFFCYTIGVSHLTNLMQMRLIIKSKIIIIINFLLFIKKFVLDEKKDYVIVRGLKDDVEKCSAHLNKIVKELAEENFMLEVPIFKQFHKFVIGKGGANIKKIRDETQTKIELPGEDDRSDVIRIIGREENANLAKVKNY